MRTSTAFFAGVGTVFVAIAAGLGGGLTIANFMSPQTPQYGKLDRRPSPDAASTKDPMVPVPYLAATKESANAAVIVSPAEQKPQQNGAANSSPPATPPASSSNAPANVTASNDHPEKSSEAVKPSEAMQANAAKASEAPAKPVAIAQPVVASSAPEDAYAKARDTDLKRDADLRRDADQKRAERRKAERRQQQWAERRRLQQARDQDDLRGVEQAVREDRPAVREDSEARAYPVYREVPARAEFPIRLFGDD
jgi:hypothetical protein